MQENKLEQPDTSNYFNFYGLEAKFEVSKEVLKSLYLEKSKTYHPDFYANDPKSYNTALMASAYNNQAYKTLDSDISRATYLLDLNGQKLENVQLPQDFLMEMLELNEAIDAMTPTDRYDLEDKVDNFRKSALEQIRNSAIAENWETLRMHILEWRYLERLKERLID